ncbi:MAG: amidase [Bacteroidetes bacterium]|nr:amidase [Bacteroidota bacterium]
MKTTDKRVHGFTDDALADLDAVALSALIKAKEIHPREIVAASIERAKKVDPFLNAVVTDCYEKGLVASNRPQTGFFAGIPTFIKDMTYVKGMPTYFGSEAFANAKPAKKTDPIAKQIFAQGFVNLGTSSMPEFGFTCSTEFENQKDTCNPWNIGHTPGGSSGGAGALVAAGVVPIAHAADGGGSTRIPAACCGVVGLKPTRGRLLKTGLFQHQLLDIAIDGVITRSIRDTIHFYAEAEKYYKNPKLAPVGLVKSPSKRTYKIGFSGDSVNDLKADAPTMESLHKTAELLESLGHTVKMVKPPISDQFLTDFIDIWAMNAFYCYSFGKLMFGPSFMPHKVSKLTRGLTKHHFKNILKTPFFVHRLRKSYHHYEQMFSEMDIDIMLTPTIAHAAPELGYMGMDLEFDELFPRIVNWACFSPYGNASGGPSISLPLGYDKAKELPIGMLFWANHGQENLLFDIALQLEEAQPWKKITDN